MRIVTTYMMHVCTWTLKGVLSMTTKDPNGLLKPELADNLSVYHLVSILVSSGCQALVGIPK